MFAPETLTLKLRFLVASAETTATRWLLGALHRWRLALRCGGTTQVLIVEVWWNIAASTFDQGGQFFRKQNAT